MIFFIALLLGVLAYAVTKFIISKVSAIAELADIIALVVGVLVALWYAGAIR